MCRIDGSVAEGLGLESRIDIWDITYDVTVGVAFFGAILYTVSVTRDRVCRLGR